MRNPILIERDRKIREMRDKVPISEISAAFGLSEATIKVIWYHKQYVNDVNIPDKHRQRYIKESIKKTPCGLSMKVWPNCFGNGCYHARNLRCESYLNFLNANAQTTPSSSKITRSACSRSRILAGTLRRPNMR